MKPVTILCWFVLTLGTSPTAYGIVAMYDKQIEAASNMYLPGLDWRLYKAQLIAESNLNPDAVSPVGAKGIAQFMPGTWYDVALELNFPPKALPTDPEYAIPAGAYYMSKQFKSWTAPRPDVDRFCLALASYNAGFGNLLKAQHKAGGANEYNVIIAALPQVTGRHAVETATYVWRILRIFSGLVTG